MKTIYIDVYFMINFTVDILAVFLAARMIHIKINMKKLLLSGFVGSVFATAELFLKQKAHDIILAVLFLLALSFIIAKRVSVYRKAKFILAFYIAAFLISGTVNFVYGLLDKYIDDIFADTADTTNRKAIIFSLIILLIIGVLRLFIMMVSDSINEKSTRIRIELGKKSIEVDALIDTGNLVKDPMNMNPVIFLKKTSAKEIIPEAVIDLSHIDNLATDLQKRIRLVPVSRNNETHVMTGLRVDRVFVLKENFKEEINATIVIDKEEGTFGGYYALAPYVAAINNV